VAGSVAALSGQRAGHRARALSRARRGVVFYLGVLVLSLFFFGPFVWTILSSLKDASEIATFPPTFLPARLRFENYARAWTLVPFLRFYVNSTIVTGLAMLGQTLTATMVAYGFARFRFPGRDRLFLLVLSSLMLPIHVTLIPTFVMFYQVGWIDTFLPLIVPSYFGGGAFAIFLLRQFFRTLPLDLDEAAKIDGASYPRIFWTILLPLSKPGLLALAVLGFLADWEDFLRPLIYLQSKEKLTLSIGLRFLASQAGVQMPGEPTTHLLMAASIVATIPPILLYVVVQRQLVQGIALTGSKG
jgi:ABC-type glycerol-3-phosphate transport system permease component